MNARFRFILLFLTLAAHPCYLRAQDLDQRETFAKAHAAFSAGNFSEAKELFHKTLDPKHQLADYSLHYLAIIATNEKNWDLSRRLLSQLRQRFPQSVWFHDAALELAKIDLAEKKYKPAISTLRALRAARGGRNDTIQESLHLEAQAQEAKGEMNQAYALYHELRSTYPLSRWTPSARKEQARLRDKYPDLFGFHTFQSLADEADRLAQEQAHGEAEILYRKLLNNVTEGDFRLGLLAKLSELYLTLRRRTEAILLLEEIAREYAESAEAPRALYRIGQILWNRHDNARALDYFKLVMERYPASADVDRAQFAAADIHDFFGRRDEAIRLYENLRKQFPGSQMRDDATWRLAWLYYRTGELQPALATFGSLATQGSDGSFRTAARYWEARAAEKLGDHDSAKQHYRQIVNGADESYYQALAVRALHRLGLAVDEAKPNKISTSAEVDPPMSSEISFHLARARELAALALHRLAVAELDEAGRQSRQSSRLRPVLMREYFRNQAYGRSLTVANQLPASYGERDLYRFPLAHWESIQRKAQERDLDPHLILALVRQESLFDARARSPAFALGLMQLLPATAARVAKQRGLEPPSNEQLFEPEINLTLGTEYLKDLLQRYSNNWFKALAAYNAGEAAVDRWEKEIVTDDIEEFVERIPYVETRGYVKLVMRNHRIYKKLYEAQK